MSRPISSFDFALEELPLKIEEFHFKEEMGMMRLVFLFVFSLSQWSVAADLDCQVSINGESYLNKGIVTELGVQKLVTRIEGTTIYVTEKRGNQFEIESFIPDYEIRMYSSGSLMAGGGPLSLSLWGRDRLIEMTCQMRAPLAP